MSLLLRLNWFDTQVCAAPLPTADWAPYHWRVTCESLGTFAEPKRAEAEAEPTFEFWVLTHLAAPALPDWGPASLAIQFHVLCAKSPQSFGWASIPVCAGFHTSKKKNCTLKFLAQPLRPFEPI